MATRVDGDYAEADAVADDLREQLAAVTAESIRLAKIVKGLDLERFDLEAENDRLLAAIAPTEENVEAFVQVRVDTDLLPLRQAARAHYAAIAARAGVKL
jgi:hypothetical protein